MNEDLKRYYDKQINAYENFILYYQKLTARALGKEYEEGDYYSPDDLVDVIHTIDKLRSRDKEYTELLDLLYNIEPDLRIRKYGDKSIKIFIMKLARQSSLYEQSQNNKSESIK